MKSKITNAGLHIVFGAIVGFLFAMANLIFKASPAHVATICVIETIVFLFAMFIRELIQAKNSDWEWDRYWDMKLVDSIVDVALSVLAFWILVCAFTGGTYVSM